MKQTKVGDTLIIYLYYKHIHTYMEIFIYLHSHFDKSGDNNVAKYQRAVDGEYSFKLVQSKLNSFLKTILTH